MPLHYDQIVAQPLTPFAIGLNIIFCLDDFTAENGATRIVPGSHLLDNEKTPEDPFDISITIAAEAPAGSAIMWDSRLWHGTGANVSSARRHAILCYLVRLWCRQTENGVLAVHPAVYDKMTDRAKALFGYRATTTLGRVQYLPDGRSSTNSRVSFSAIGI